MTDADLLRRILGVMRPDIPIDWHDQAWLAARGLVTLEAIEQEAADAKRARHAEWRKWAEDEIADLRARHAALVAAAREDERERLLAALGSDAAVEAIHHALYAGTHWRCRKYAAVGGRGKAGKPPCFCEESQVAVVAALRAALDATPKDRQTPPEVCDHAALVAAAREVCGDYDWEGDYGTGIAASILALRAALDKEPQP